MLGASLSLSVGKIPLLPTGLGVPSLALAETGDNEISYTIGEVTDANQYRVEKSTDGVTYTLLATQSTHGTYTDGGLAEGQTYYYRVRAENTLTSEVSNYRVASLALVAEFSNVSLTESTILQNAVNTFTLVFRPDVAISATGTITLSGLSGSATATNASLTIAGTNASLFGSVGDWNNDGTLILTVASGQSVPNNSDTTITFDLTNPAFPNSGVSSVTLASSGFNTSAVSGTFFNVAETVFTNTYGVDFDGTDDYMDPGSTFQSTFQSDFSISLWFNPDTTVGGALGGVFGTERNYFYRDASTVRHFYYNGSVSIQNSGSISTSVGTWYHALVTIEQSGGNVVSKIYVNGSLLNSVTAAGSVSNYTSSLNYWLGVRNRSAITQPFNGKIDEAAIFGSALSATDVNNIYNSGSPGDLSTYSPVGWWRMGDDDSGTGTTITDQGSGGNDGTLTNGPTFHDLSTAPDSIYVA